eukprot:TRINITY_DN59169_c0_g1_i1.p1 TRINITY_DN59169_c0_g1~~TRINITY_DN59169_c0_g1_i1.p1  ORF type:complete len:503 (+),score=54.13 TRINITY_DN59169_c0_g1_i1:119-1510(+)
MARLLLPTPLDGDAPDAEGADAEEVPASSSPRRLTFKSPFSNNRGANRRATLGNVLETVDIFLKNNEVRMTLDFLEYFGNSFEFGGDDLALTWEACAAVTKAVAEHRGNGSARDKLEILDAFASAIASAGENWCASEPGRAGTTIGLKLSSVLHVIYHLIMNYQVKAAMDWVGRLSASDLSTLNVSFSYDRYLQALHSFAARRKDTAFGGARSVLVEMSILLGPARFGPTSEWPQGECDRIRQFVLHTGTSSSRSSSSGSRGARNTKADLGDALGDFGGADGLCNATFQDSNCEPSASSRSGVHSPCGRQFNPAVAGDTSSGTCGSQIHDGGECGKGPLAFKAWGDPVESNGSTSGTSSACARSDAIGAAAWSSTYPPSCKLVGRLASESCIQLERAAPAKSKLAVRTRSAPALAQVSDESEDRLDDVFSDKEYVQACLRGRRATAPGQIEAWPEDLEALPGP